MSSFLNNTSNQSPWLSSDDNGTASDKKFDDDFVKASYQPLADSNQYLETLGSNFLIVMIRIVRE